MRNSQHPKSLLNVKKKFNLQLEQPVIPYSRSNEMLAVGSSSPQSFTSSNLASRGGSFGGGTRFFFCKSFLSFSPTCLYRSTRVENAVSLTVADWSDSSAAIYGTNLLIVTECVPCLKKKENNYLLIPTIFYKL